jgi:hypothetical protein
VTEGDGDAKRPLSMNWRSIIMALALLVACGATVLFAVALVPVWAFVPICALAVELPLEPPVPGAAPPLIPPV